MSDVTELISGADRLLETIRGVEDSVREFTTETRTLTKAIVLSSLIRMCPAIEDVTPAGRKVMLSRLCGQAVFLEQILRLGVGTMSQPDADAASSSETP